MLQELENDTGTWSWRRSSAAGTTSTQVPNLVDVPARRPGRPEGEPVGTAILPQFARGVSAPTDPSQPQVEETPLARDKLDAELLSYARLPEGWDGYAGVPAQLEAALDAIEFLIMRPADIPLPYPQIASDGEVGLYWRTEEVYAEVGFYGNGEFSYYARHTPRGGEVEEDGLDHCSLEADEWPEGLLLILNKLER